MQSITASSFYNNDMAWQRGSFQDRTRSANLIGTGSKTPPYMMQQMDNHIRATTPTGNYRNSAKQHQGHPEDRGSSHNIHRMNDRPATMVG